MPLESAFQELCRRVDYLETNISSLQDPPAPNMGGGPSPSPNHIVACVATEEMDRYQIAFVYEQSAAGIIPQASIYTKALANTYKGIGEIGIVKSYASGSGEVVNIQVTGLSYAFVKVTIDTLPIQTGTGLTPNDTGELEATVGVSHFVAMEDHELDDEIVMVKFKSSGGTSTFPTKIKSKDGSPGIAYTADIYGDGPSEPATVTDITVKILQIDEDETIPANTWLLTVLTGDTYYGQVPIWL